MSLKQRFKMGNEKCFAFVFYEFHFLSLSLSRHKYVKLETESKQGMQYITLPLNTLEQQTLMF